MRFYLLPVVKNTLVALDKKDGSLVWKNKSMGGTKAYASPLLINHNGIPIILAQTTDNIIGINPENGEIWWSYNLIQYHTHKQGCRCTNESSHIQQR